ncbi:anaerobic ribonucleoside-triphosphate reductase activating protein [Petrocella sp. FN5]|uniref:anaerobic ribonucleoside-triphosphate reductase activating protein n=1 Tax=Petrocella sp. FN5 TaxID=3032002 RepID=UPI0023DC67FB|nr:anaerobic ribonucleoside-triphosphate reductase activating protein [Petrocella sp. FN5]MDF1617448.1 anaerobic ribonucleoside-triphosphate reductase activating protein [Petrocella sp. FN5]
MNIAAYIKTSMVDFDGHLSATVFTKGCNMICDYCHNRDLKNQPSLMDEEEVLKHLDKRKGILTGVTLSGGEPTLQEDLIDFVTKVKNLGYAIKLDTNGSNPAMLKTLHSLGLIDYVAMDLKTAPSNYRKLTGMDFEQVRESYDFVRNLQHYEFRTTMYPEVSFEDVGMLLKMVDRGHYVLQQYRPNHSHALKPYEDQELLTFAKVNGIAIRGM